MGVLSGDNERLEFFPGLTPSNPGSLCVTEEEFFIIPDYGAGDIKIYEKKGTSLRWVKAIGRRGYGPGELAKPSYSFYDKVEGQLAIMDFGRKKILIFHRIVDEFKLVKEIPCGTGAWDIKLGGKRLFISGYITDPDKNPYDFYFIDITNDKITYLMPSHYKYGLKSFLEYEKEYRNKRDIQAIGVAGWFDIHGDNVYFSWEGNLKVRKLNFVSGEIDETPFGNKKTNYVESTKSEFKELLNAYKKKDLNLTMEERKKRSYVKNILTTSNHVLVIYGGAGGQGNWMQFYSFDGRFLKEVSIPGQTDGAKMWMDKEKQILYTLSSESKVGSNQYFILKYAIL
jgi:hypothetical protein